MSDIDVLTGLPNRRGLIARLDDAMAATRRGGGATAVLFIDFDGFKAVNDLRGHATGDIVLCEMARRLRARLRATDTVARLGGDEFVVVVERIDEAATAARLAEKILQVVTDDVVVDGETFGLTASIGISLFPGDGTTSEALITAADAAMYTAKADGKNAVRHCSPRLHAAARERRALEQALRAAIASGELELHYQPEWHLTDGRLSGLSARLRWRRPELGVVTADDLLAIADQCGISVTLGHWMVATAAADAARLRRAGFSLPIAVALTARQLGDRALAGRLRRALEDESLPGASLRVDVHEAVAASASRDVLATLHELHGLGVTLAVDGFGRGVSSIASLRSAPFTLLGLHREVVALAAGASPDVTLAAGVVALARQLGLTVVADGVDGADAALRLAAVGCERMQGTHFAQPLLAAELPGYCRWACSPIVGTDGVGAPDAPRQRRPLAAIVERLHPIAGGPPRRGPRRITVA